MNKKENWLRRLFGRMLKRPAASSGVAPSSPEPAASNIEEAFASTIRGLTLFVLGRPEEALAAFEQAIRLDPGNSVTYLSQGIVLKETGRPEEALAAFEQAIRLDPGNSNAYFSKESVLGELGRAEEARSAHQQAIRLAPSDASASRRDIFRRHEQPEETLAASELISRLGPNAVLASMSFALDLLPSLASMSKEGVLEEPGRSEEAEEARIARRQSPPAPSDYVQGLVLAGNGQLEEALAVFEQIIRLDPSDASAYSSKGSVLGQLGRSEEALSAHEQAIHLTPGSSFAYYSKGNTLSELGRLEEALAAFEQATRLARDKLTSASAYQKQGTVLQQLGRLEEAERVLQRARALRHRS